jgi:hypothetical protein
MPKTIDRYEILEPIARGGMGSLYLAFDPKINRRVAIKTINADLTEDEVRKRFTREAHAIGGLNHPNVVTLFDFGEFEGGPFIVMEYIEGKTLGVLIRDEEPLSIERKLSLLEGLCCGLSYAHRAGIVHRDVKPANLMVDTHGVLKILDFGIARSMTTNLTQANKTPGTPAYMAPEQIEGGRTIDHRTDLFAVGAVAYELFTNQRAFTGDTNTAVMFSVLKSEPPLIDVLAPGVGNDVVAIVKKALQKSVAARYQTAERLQRELESARIRRERARGSGLTMTSLGDAAVGSFRQRLVTKLPAGRWLWSAAAIALLGTAAALYWRPWNAAPISPPPDTTPPVVGFASLRDAAAVSGALPIAITASDNVGVAGVQVTIDGQAFGSEFVTAPYETSWNSTTVPDGHHTILLTVRDAAGNRATASIAVTTRNAPGAAPTAVDQAEINRVLDEAKREAQNGDYNAALKTLAGGQSKWPNNADLKKLRKDIEEFISPVSGRGRGGRG